MEKTKPDIMSFVTNPGIRLEYVEMAARHHVKGLIFEKPMANTIEEAKRILDICETNRIKAVICHQHKYLPLFQKMKTIVDSGELGRTVRIEANCQSWASQIATHYIDYMLWIGNNIQAKSVVGHTHGDRFMHSNHPSPEFIMGEIRFEKGVTGNIQCGYFTHTDKPHDVDYDQEIFPLDFWADCRLTVRGENGYLWAECDGHMGRCTSATGGKLEASTVPGFWEIEGTLQIPYAKDFIAWMDDSEKVHPCNVSQAYRGFEILEGIYRSDREHRRVDLPLVL